MHVHPTMILFQASSPEADRRRQSQAALLNDLAYILC